MPETNSAIESIGRLLKNVALCLITYLIRFDFDVTIFQPAFRENIVKFVRMAGDTIGGWLAPVAQPASGLDLVRWQWCEGRGFDVVWRL